MTLERLRASLADRYRIERQLGQGGMATVYLAEDLKHHRKVAIKVLRPELAAVLGGERFVQEITTTAQLQHPRILPLFDSGQADSFLYYVMPYVEGETLRSRLDREKQLGVDEAVKITTEVADALDYAHRHGVIHRDIKPENILLQDGGAVLADFGIALAVTAAGGTRLTETGLNPGTPHYMSPEQALGERDLDSRSDLYALGCVLYETLTGEPPHTGPTAQAIAAKCLTQTPAPVRTVRETVPAALELALARVLAKVPADRFATARDFAAAVGGSLGTSSAGIHAPTAAPARLTRARLLGAVLLLVVLAGLVVQVIRGGRPRKELDANLLAVAPFDVAGPGLEVWREGIIDLLARTLDGAGNLRTVSPSVVLRGFTGRSDRASALALGQRTGAGMVATGSLSQLAPGRVRLRVTLLDARADELLGDVEVEGAPDALGQLADSLGLGILRALARTRPVAAVRQASISAVPLGALKAYLVGEQAYRRGSYDSALAAYQSALAQDSGLTLAMYRMAQVLGWSPPSASLYPPSTTFLLRAIVRNRGLPARESLLIGADSAGFFSDPAHSELDALALARLLEATRRFPGDPEVWYALGEKYYPHSGYIPSANNLAAFEAFERALELDPGFAPAYEHVLPLAISLGREDRALVHARAAAGLQSSASYSRQVRLTSRLLLLPESERPEALAAELDTTPAGDLYSVAGAFSGVPDPHETAVQLFRRLADRSVASGEAVPWVVDSRMRRRYLALALARRGHLREAVRVAADDLATEVLREWWSSWQDPFASLMMLGAIPAEDAERVFAPALAADAPIRDAFARRWRGASWWAERGDTASLALFERRMQAAVRRPGPVRTRLAAEYLGGIAGAYLALARGDSVTALARFRALPDSVFCVGGLVSCMAARLTEAALLAARHDAVGAASILDSASGWDGPVAVLAALRRAQLAEQLDDRALARRKYEFVLASWRTADPELQHYVDDAKAGLARLNLR